MLLTILLLIDVFIQGELGTGWARALTVGEIIATGSVFVLSIKHGIGGADKVDKICYILWAVAVVCWLGLHRPLLALNFGVFADLIAMVPTFMKSWKNPEEESANVFAASALSGFIAIFAAQEYTYRAILLPVYLFLVNLAVVVVLAVSEKHRKRLAASR